MTAIAPAKATPDPTSDLLRETHAIQNEGRALERMQEAGLQESAAYTQRLLDFAKRRQMALMMEVRTPADALALVHLLQQSAGCVSEVAQANDPEVFKLLSLELQAGLVSLVPYLETVIGLSKAQLNLDYSTPPATWH